MHLSGLAVINIQSPVKLMMIFMAMSAMGFSIGVALGAWVPLFPIVENITKIFIGRPLFFISGVFFTIEMIPIEFREILLLNPLFHLIEMFRSAFFISFESEYTDPSYAISSILILLVTALLTQRALRKYVMLI